MNLSNGFFEIVKEPQDAKLISCTNHTPGNLTGNILFNNCFGTNTELQNGMDTNSGRFTIPQDGYYSISFSGSLKSIDGSRIWLNLNMKDSKTGEGRKSIITIRNKTCGSITRAVGTWWQGMAAATPIFEKFTTVCHILPYQYFRDLL